MKQSFILLFAVILPFTLLARVITIKKTIYWQKAEETVIDGSVVNSLLICTSCNNDPLKANLPEIIEKIDLSAGEYIRTVRFTSISSAEVTEYSFSKSEKRFIPNTNPEFNSKLGIEKKSWKGIIRFTPLIQKNGTIEKVTSFELEIDVAKGSFNPPRNNKAAFVSNSVLSSGDWYKIGVDHNGVYKISYKYLKQAGIDVDNIDPRNIAVYGNGGAMLPRKNSDPRADDLIENSIIVQGETDGSFDKSDYILFYAEGPNKWYYDDQIDNVFKHIKHEFSDTSYYFIRFSGPQGKRISTVNITGSSPFDVDQFDDYKFHEVDKVNLIKSGALWFGEAFDIQDSYTFNFSFPNTVNGVDGFLTCSVATASRLSSSYSITGPGLNDTINARTALGTYGARFAHVDGKSAIIKPSGDLVQISLRYNKPAGYSSAKGWLDYIEINVRRNLILTGTQMAFRDLNSVGNNFARYSIKGASNKTKVWDITDINNPVQHSLNVNGGLATFINNSQDLHQYIAVEDFDSTYYWQGLIGNQNLHSESNYDYIIVSHPRFLSAAERLQAIHTANGLNVFITTPQKIYNEFSSGSQDITAIRDFIRMVYQRNSGPNQLKYVLFMGDGSYDNKSRVGGNTNYVPTFESRESGHPAESYVSDDYYCLLDSSEGEWKNNELMDVGIGRIPCQTLDQANGVVDKIERYLAPKAMADWRNVICFIGDDEDNNIHMEQPDALSYIVDTTDANYNIEKIFIDAFKQYSTPGGERYPDAQEAIKRQVQRGVLIVSYTGHGGEVGWAHERILTMDEINNWTNRNELPLFLTATCEFSRWDDPQRAAGGEVVLLNPNGGGIALLTTVRLVYSFANQQLATSFYKTIFDPINGEMPHLGDVYMKVKNSVPGINTRNFTLLGDPALRLAYPLYNVVTDSINGVHISQVDTVRALSLVEFKGHLEDNNGNKMSNFNGTLYPTVFDKEYDIQTLNNDGFGAFKFSVQNKKLFKGKTQVTNGDYSFKFIIPKDIAYNYGNGRVSYYAENQIVDANGYSNDFIVGGTDKNAPSDNVGPEIELYMNDETFIYGGITDENPLLIAKVYDLHGINMAGTGIGHDITAVLDGKTDEPLVLNEYYSAATNSYQDGEVNYPFEDLAPGPHKLTFKVWDVYNNSSEATLEFVVQEFKDIQIEKVLNYPNPFTTNTAFWFEHNQPNTVLDVKVQIFTISGKIVKTIDRVIETAGYNQNRKNPITWDGKDEYGDKLGRGVYIYKLKVRSRRNGTSDEKIEKLVIL